MNNSLLLSEDFSFLLHVKHNVHLCRLLPTMPSDNTDVSLSDFFEKKHFYSCRNKTPTIAVTDWTDSNRCDTNTRESRVFLQRGVFIALHIVSFIADTRMDTKASLWSHQFQIRDSSVCSCVSLFPPPPTAAPMEQ